MSAAAVQAKILEPMQQVYVPPRDMAKSDQAAALRQYVGVLQRFDDADLDFAWAHVVETHPNRTWPVPSIFAAAARNAVKDRVSTGKATRHGNAGDQAAQRWEVWKAVSRSRLAAEAAEMNVAWSLKCAILHDGKLPDQVSLTDLAAGKRSAERTATKIRSGEGIEYKGRILHFTDDNAAAALSLWKAILQREPETQAEIAMAQRRAA